MGAKISLETHLLNGKRVSNVIDRKSLTNDETIQEALDHGFVVGKPENLSAIARGVLKCMINGVERDGDGRKIDEYFSLQPVATGKLDDITDDIDKSKIGVKARARALKQLKIDTSEWTISTEGTTGDITISSITTGEEDGKIVVNANEATHINGNFNTTDELVVKYYIPDTSKSSPVTIATEKITRDATRITIAAEVLAELEAEEFEGKSIFFQVHLGNAVGIKSAEIVLV